MKSWLKWTLIGVGLAVILWGALSWYFVHSNGTDDYVSIELGTKPDGSMYMRCLSATGGASCTPGDQTTITVHQRDAVHFTVTSKDVGAHAHDFNIGDWQYLVSRVWPTNSPELELDTSTQNADFTAWASGTFRILCELPGHDALGMHGTFVVV